MEADASVFVLLVDCWASHWTQRVRPPFQRAVLCASRKRKCKGRERRRLQSMLVRHTRTLLCLALEGQFLELRVSMVGCHNVFPPVIVSPYHDDIQRTHKRAGCRRNSLIKLLEMSLSCFLLSSSWVGVRISTLTCSIIVWRSGSIVGGRKEWFVGPWKFGCHDDSTVTNLNFVRFSKVRIDVCISNRNMRFLHELPLTVEHIQVLLVVFVYDTSHSVVGDESKPFFILS